MSNITFEQWLDGEGEVRYYTAIAKTLSGSVAPGDWAGNDSFRDEHNYLWFVDVFPDGTAVTWCSDE